MSNAAKPTRPKETIDYEECVPMNPTGAAPGNQGDIAITDPANAEEIAYADAPAFPDDFAAATGRRTGTTASSTSPTSCGAS